MSGKTEKARRVGATADLGEAKTYGMFALILYHKNSQKSIAF
jgi:hypothetical protein